jgi:hypothetical protein
LDNLIHDSLPSPRPVGYQSGKALVKAPRLSKIVAAAGVTAILLLLTSLFIAVVSNQAEPKISEHISYTSPPKAVIEYATIAYDGGEYTGWLRDGLPHGQGTLKYPVIERSSAFVNLLLHRGTKAMVYEGEWQYGFKHGYGKMTYPSGKIEEGYWEKGLFVGQSGN